jgi:hypothetical protein
MPSLAPPGVVPGETIQESIVRKEARMKHARSKVLGATAVVAALLYSGSALSQVPWHIVPAAACAGADESAHRFTHQNGKFRNSSGTNDLLVSCPLRTRRIEMEYLAAVSIVVDQGVAANDCVVVDRSFDGSSGQSYSYDYTNPQGSHTQIVWTSSGGAGQMPNTLANSHSLTIVCELDDGETLYNFHHDY